MLGSFVPELAPHGRVRPQSAIEQDVFAALATLPDVRAFKLNDRGERDLSFSILSPNEADLNAAVARLEDALRDDPLLANVATEGAVPRPEVQVTPRLEEAARLGVTTRSIAETVASQP